MKTLKMNGGVLTISDEFFESLVKGKINKLEMLLNPKMWGQDQMDAWHENMPDLQKAFDSLRNSINKG